MKSDPVSQNYCKVKVPIIISGIVPPDPCFILYTHGLICGELPGLVVTHGSKEASQLHWGLQI